MGNTDSPTPAPEAHLNRRSTRRSLVTGALIIILVILVGFFAVNVLHIGQKVYAQAAGHKIYKKEIKNLLNGNTTVTDQQAAIVLADKYLSEAMVKEQGITVTQAEIKTATPSITTTGSQPVQLNAYARQNLVNQLYFSKLNDHYVGVYTGKLIVANFSRYVPYQSALLPTQEAETPNLGNATAIAADKQYAQDFISSLYNQIKSKKITFDQAIQMEHDDPVVGEKAYATQQHSKSFNGPIGQIGLLSARSIRSKVTSMKPGELSKPFVVRVSNSSTDPKSTAESYFLLVRMDKVSGSNNGMTFAQELAKAKKQLGYKIND